LPPPPPHHPPARPSSTLPRLNRATALGPSPTTFLGNVGIGTASPALRLTVAGDMEVGTNSADYRYLRIGGGNSSGFLYGSYPALGDGVHLGYNFYYDAAGAGQIIHSDGPTSRISVGYGTVVLATGAVNTAPVQR